jgi:hypothetical protein
MDLIKKLASRKLGAAIGGGWPSVRMRLSAAVVASAPALPPPALLNLFGYSGYSGYNGYSR